MVPVEGVKVPFFTSGVSVPVSDSVLLPLLEKICEELMVSVVILAEEARFKVVAPVDVSLNAAVVEAKLTPLSVHAG